jgi:hypothetical protein
METKVKSRTEAAFGEKLSRRWPSITLSRPDLETRAGAVEPRIRKLLLSLGLLELSASRGVHAG